MKIIVKTKKKKIFLWFPTRLIVNPFSLNIILKGVKYQYPDLDVNVEDILKALRCCYHQELVNIQTKEGDHIYICL